MTLSGLLIALVVSAEPVTALELQRTPFEALTERALGTASRAVRFDWRRTTVGFGVTSAALLELNNFASGRVGGFVRTPLGSNFMLELAFTRVFTWGSTSSELLGLTPYRQYARPSRVELDLNASYALFEGVATARPGFIPAAQFVFSVSAGLRYLFYPGSLNNMSAGEVAGAIFAPGLGDTEVTNMNSQMLPGMQLDRSRYQVLAGFQLDVYFQPGLFVTPRVMLGIPLISAPTGRGIGWWWEMSLLAGWQL